MADINVVLRGLDGDPVTYEGVTAVNLPTEDSTHPFYALEKLNIYLVRMAGKSLNDYYVISNLGRSVYENTMSAYIHDTTIRENGYYLEAVDKYSASVIITPKELTVGETYARSEVMY